MANGSLTPSTTTTVLLGSLGWSAFENALDVGVDSEGADTDLAAAADVHRADKGERSSNRGDIIVGFFLNYGRERSACS